MFEGSSGSNRRRLFLEQEETSAHDAIIGWTVAILAGMGSGMVLWALYLGARFVLEFLGVQFSS